MSAPKQNFLIVKLSSIGDIVHALPFLRTLRKHHPKAHISWMIEERFHELIKHNPDLDEVLPVRIKHWRKNINADSWREISKTRQLLKDRKFDWTFDLQGLIKTGVIARMTGAPNRAGFHRNNCREKMNAWFNNRHSKYVPPGGHVTDLCLSQLSVMGNFLAQAEFPLTILAEDEQVAKTFMQENPELKTKPVAGINPGAGFPTKLWSLEQFAEL